MRERERERERERICHLKENINCNTFVLGRPHRKPEHEHLLTETTTEINNRTIKKNSSQQQVIVEDFDINLNLFTLLIINILI